jgi:secreted trypsin-like serine protease
MRIALIAVFVLGIASIALAGEFRCTEVNVKQTLSRVVGGVDANADSTGWQVSLQLDGAHFCGGSLIQNDAQGAVVLTAAHCLTREIEQAIKQGRITVRHGALQVSAGYKLVAKRALVHRGWTGAPNNGFDIALVQLQGKFPITRNEQVVTLPQNARAATEAGRCALVSGWGFTQDPNAIVGKSLRSGAVLPENLKAVRIPMVNRALCQKAYTALAKKGVIADGQLPSDQLCAGLPQGGADTCQGDSGGPLTVQYGPIRVQVGVVSWGAGCGGAQAYGLYTDVMTHLSWIKACVQGKAQCTVRQNPDD